MQIPDCLAHLPRWGEFPIPFTTPEFEPGQKPLFRTIDPKKHQMCVRFFLCGVCGKYIERPPYGLILGPMCVDLGIVFAQPQHPVCSRAALSMCPFLSRGEYSERKLGQGRVIEGTSLDELPPKPPRMALCLVDRFDTFPNPESGLLYIRMPPQPYPIEWMAYDAAGVLQPEVQP